MRRGRLALAPALLAALALTTAGCGGSGGGADRVTFQFFGDAEEAALYGELARAYTRKTGTEVQVIPVPDRDSHLAKLTTSFSANRAPDVFLLNYRNLGPYQARGVLDPVAPRLARSTKLRPTDYFRPPLEAFTIDGALQCLPQNASSLVVYYNRTLFRRAGLGTPARDWRYADFMRAARRLRDAPGIDRKTTNAVGLDPGIIRLAPFVWSAGGELVDDLDEPTRYDFDTHEARRGIDRFLAIYREELTPTESATEAQALDERFIAGDLGMFLSSRREVPAFQTIKSFQWDVAAFPRAERSIGVLHSDAFCLARGDRADAAWRFVEFAGGPDGQRLLARGGRIVPSLREVAESPAFLDPREPPATASVFLEAIPTLRRLPNHPEWPRIEDAASLAFKRAFYDEMTVDQAVQRIEAETAGLFRASADR